MVKMYPTSKQMGYADKIADTLGIPRPDPTNAKVVREFIGAHKEAFYKKSDEILYDRIKKEIQITDYAKELGYTLVKKGRYYSLKEHDSVIIDPEKNYFWRNSQPGAGSSIGYGDSVIGFAKMFSDKSIQDIMEEFSARISEIEISDIHRTSDQRLIADEKKDLKEVTLELPEKNENMKRVYAYLIKSRGIESSIVQYFVDNRLLYQDKMGNCVFIGYDKDDHRPVYAMQRGTNTSRRFVRDCRGCDYNQGMYINHGSDTLIVNEAAIDSMSMMSILQTKGCDIKKYNYLILGGSCKIEAVLSHIDHDAIKNLVIAVDSDEGGRKSIEAIKKLLKEKNVDVNISECLPEVKDWNEQLQVAARNGLEYKDISLKNLKLEGPPNRKRELNGYMDKYCQSVRSRTQTINRDLMDKLEL